MKRKWIITTSVLLLAIASILWVCLRPEPAIVVTGRLPAKEVAELKAAIRRQTRHAVLPDYSWKSFRNFPHAVKEYTQYKIKFIHTPDDGPVIVILTRSEVMNENSAHVYYYEKGPNGWHTSPNVVGDRSVIGDRQMF